MGLKYRHISFYILTILKKLSRFTLNNLFKNYLKSVCMCVLPTYLYVFYIYVWCSQSPGVGVRFPGTGVRNGWELPYGHWTQTQVL